MSMSDAEIPATQPSMPPEKVMIFLDGQNLLYACASFSRKSGTGKRFWYNESKLERMLLNMRPNRRLVQVRFYTAVAEVDPDRKGDEKRFQGQMNSLSVLQSARKWYVFYKIVRAYPVYCPYCRKEGKEIVTTCPECKRELEMPKNKGVDVALATDLLVYGLHDRYPYDTAIIVSGDTDFAPVIDSIKTHRPEVRIEVVQFKESVGDKLRLSPNVIFYDLDSKISQFGKFE
jgi:uncharacterized LabA/DUF88 family protein